MAGAGRMSGKREEVRGGGQDQVLRGPVGPVKEFGMCKCDGTLLRVLNRRVA